MTQIKKHMRNQRAQIVIIRYTYQYPLNLSYKNIVFKLKEKIFKEMKRWLQDQRKQMFQWYC